jgi:hypothetical protein
VPKALVALIFGAALWLAPGALAAGWCGNDATAADRTDIVTGRQVHMIVALPADAPDTFVADANRLADDVGSADGWWRGQDSTRTPRWDQATFTTGNCLDISFVRLTDASAAYGGAGASAAFLHIQASLGAAGYDNAYKKYLVYFDGPSVEDNVCGTGAGGSSTGASFAVVWLQGCPDIPADSIAVHELLHALGALPDGAPHACPLAQGGPGHPCDSQQDVLYPFTTGAPLSSLILDVNHDDYYGHSGSWNDIQDSLWLSHLDSPQQALSVSLDGAGEIRSEAPGVDCTAACSTQWDMGSSVGLAAVAAKTDRFVRWSGGCTGRLACTVKLDGPVSVSAVFGPLRIPVTARAAGHGTVVCSPSCSRSFPAGTRLVLRAVAANGWKFSGWTGACKGRPLVCSPATDYALTVRATFRRR